MNDSLRMRLGAVVLALLTLAAMIFAVLNFQQRSRYILPDDGVTWMDTSQGVVAWHVVPDSPAAKAGIKKGDYVAGVRGIPIHRATEVTRVLFRSGPWTELRYQMKRGSGTFETPVVTAPQENPSSIENYLRITALLYLFIGLFIFVRRWNAPRAIHFYVFCLVSFVLYSFHYSGKLNSFDWIIYWTNVVALLLQPALLVHFALVFPERRGWVWPKIAATYAVPVALLTLHVFVATGTLDFMPSIGNRDFLDTIELVYMGAYFLAAAGIFLLSYRRAPSGILRQQLKWVTGGTFAGILPFLLLYVVPRLANVIPQPWMKASAYSLALIPLCFGYAIIRYRLMDVDIIFKRGLAYTFATAGVVAVYFLGVALIGELFHTSFTTGPAGGVIAIVVAAFLFQPLRDGVQTRLDRFFYRDRLDYRRTLIEFGRTLTNEVRLEPLVASVLDRISQTLLVDRLAIFLEDPGNPGRFILARSMGLRAGGQLDLSFLDPSRPAFDRGCLFIDSGRAAVHETESVRRTLEHLDLNYFIACKFRDRTVAMLGLGRTVDGDYLSTDDLELLSTIAGYVAIAIENARLYQSLEQKAVQIERLKDFSENIVESLNVGVLTVDLEDRVESWNSQLEALLELPRREAVRRRLAEVLPPDLVAEIAARAAGEHVSGIYKHQLHTAGGRQVVVNASVAPLVGKNGARLGRLILLDDITQRVRLEEQLVQTEKLTSLGLLAAGVAHEVNTPLAVISNYIQMLAKQIPSDDPRQKTIDRIVKQTFRASEIVNNLLNFSRTGAAEFVEINLNLLIEETLVLVQHPFKTAQVNVIKNYTQQLPLVLGSSTRLQQVFLNLFMNARDAMPGGGMLEVRTATRNGSVEVEVADTGTGIEPEHLQRIFDPFFTTKASGRGTGLGLSVSYGIIKEHAGKVDVRSTPGKGTAFRLEFPVARKAVHA
ncbi:MAG TPA: ATP-binding protein [Candidatus Sulfotelmatobacter sp.]|nr:ATP-binding protein [Candidatus Sulfotelmatobacter sp.]